jgi:galactokinase
VYDQAQAATALLRDAFDADPAVVASAPGRVNLVGGHTDYNDGFVLPVAIDRRTAVAARPRDDHTVRARSTAFDDGGSFRADAPERAGDWIDYVKGVAWALADTGHPVDGADIAIAGDVPLGAGLASSAALEIAVAAALRAAWSLDVTDRDLADAVHRAETGFVGVDCGIMDQYAAALGRDDAALLLDCRSRDVRPVPLGDAAIVVTDTNVRHSLADSAYNQRRAACGRGVELLADRLPDVTALRDVSPADLDAHRDALPADIANRCEHVVHENRRVRAAADALDRGDLDAVGGLLLASHRSLRDLYDVSCDELDAVVDIARGVYGVYGARMTGAGFGGSVVALVEPGAVGEFRAAVEEEYPERTGLGPDVYECEPDEGARIKSD